MQQPDEPLRPDKSEVSEKEIQDQLDIMTLMNKRAQEIKEIKSLEFRLAVMAYTRALEWVTKHNISYTFDEEHECYVALKDS